MLRRTERRQRLKHVELVRRGMQELTIAFQPIRDLRTHAVTGYEALSRFPSGDAATWFATAHELGVGTDLELAAMTKALATRRPEWGYVSVNVSPVTVIEPEFLDLVLAVEEPRRLVLELTEHDAVDDYDELSEVVRRLQAAGVLVAVDDAGGGTSSLRHILEISPDVIKMDRSLVAKLDTDRARKGLAELMVEFSKSLGAALVAEGIERQEELDACLDAGITLGQGYLLGRPASPSEAVEEPSHLADRRGC